MLRLVALVQAGLLFWGCAWQALLDNQLEELFAQRPHRARAAEALEQGSRSKHGLCVQARLQPGSAAKPGRPTLELLSWTADHRLGWD